VDIKDQKSNLRAELKSIRSKINNKNKLSQLIINICIDYVDWTKIKSLHTYLGSVERGEINTWKLLEFVWQHYSNIQTFSPKVIDNKIRSTQIDKESEWETNKWGFLEPKSSYLTDESAQFDIIFVPLLGFDRHGHRIGHGSGHYDRYLQTQANATKIGLAFADLECRLVPTEAHDQSLDIVITESEVINFK
jgi:5-formyltetrahydrofolate cyclo-ligase